LPGRLKASRNGLNKDDNKDTRAGLGGRGRSEKMLERGREEESK